MWANYRGRFPPSPLGGILGADFPTLSLAASWERVWEQGRVEDGRQFVMTPLPPARIAEL